ncbi:MAG: DUF465 domain-containing protein [Pseudomonadota bacterium]
MALDAHVAELQSKHRAVARKIEEAQLHPSVDDLTITRLKREKLRLKDQLRRIEQVAD